ERLIAIPAGMGHKSWRPSPLAGGRLPRPVSGRLLGRTVPSDNGPQYVLWREMRRRTFLRFARCASQLIVRDSTCGGSESTMAKQRTLALLSRAARQRTENRRPAWGNRAIVRAPALHCPHARTGMTTTRPDKPQPPGEGNTPFAEFLGRIRAGD